MIRSPGSARLDTPTVRIITSCVSTELGGGLPLSTALSSLSSIFVIGFLALAPSTNSEPADGVSADRVTLGSGGIQLEVQIDPDARLAHPSGIHALIQSDRDIHDVTVGLELSPGVRGDGSLGTLIPFLHGGLQTAVSFPVTITSPGDHRIAVKASDPRGHRAYRVVYANADGSEVYIGDRPLSDRSSPPVTYAEADHTTTAPHDILTLLREKAPIAPRALGQDDGGVEPQSPGALTVTGRWTFLNEHGATEGLRGAWVLVWDEDIFSLDDLLWSGITDPGGYFTTPLLDNSDESGTLDVYLELRLETANTAKVMPESGSEPWRATTQTVANVPDGTFDAGSWRPSGADFEAATRIFHQLTEAWRFAANFGEDIGAVGARYPGPDGDGPHYHPLTSSAYGGEIHIPSGEDWDLAEKVTVHEHGHYVMDRAYTPFNPSPGGPHGVCDDDEDRGLAWSEGWATAWALFVFDDPVFAWPGGDSVNYETANDCALSTTHHDHSEFRVTAALWDLYDPAVDGLDMFAFGADEIWHTLNDFVDANLAGFYDSWRVKGFDSTAFLATAFLNTIDYDQPPTVTLTGPATVDWLRGTVQVTASASDPDNPIQYVDFWYSLDGSVYSSLGRDTSPAFSWSWNTTGLTDTSVWLRIQAFDGIKRGAFAVSVPALRIDNAAPTTSYSATGTAGFGGWYRSTVTVTLSATDDGSGVETIQYRVDGGEWTDYIAPFRFEESGEYEVEYHGVDEAGNVEPLRVFPLKADKRGPSVVVDSPLNASVLGSGSVRVEWTADDEHSGLANCTVSKDLDTPVDTPTGVTSHLVTVPDGAHEVVVRCKDLAGNAAEATVTFSVSTGIFVGLASPGILTVLVGIPLAVAAIVLALRRLNSSGRKPPGG